MFASVEPSILQEDSLIAFNQRFSLKLHQDSKLRSTEQGNLLDLKLLCGWLCVHWYLHSTPCVQLTRTNMLLSKSCSHMVSIVPVLSFQWDSLVTSPSYSVTCWPFCLIKDSKFQKEGIGQVFPEQRGLKDNFDLTILSQQCQGHPLRASVWVCACACVGQTEMLSTHGNLCPEVA